MTSRDLALIDTLGIDAVALARMQAFELALRKWSKVKNLVAPSAFADLWTRHLLDSAQVQRAEPKATTWVDLGSGGGFPGIVTAILLADRGESLVHLVEADHRKCAFLRDVSRETGLRTKVHNARIEDVVPHLGPVDAVSARALADMDRLVAWSEPLIEKGATGVFLKGKGAASELTALSRDSRFIIETSPSLSQSGGVLVKVRKSGNQGAAHEHS